MNKLVLLACVAALFAVASAGGIGLGLGLGAPGYGLITGLTKLPNLGYGNVATVNSNLNLGGYQIANLERGPVSVRSHLQSAVAPVGVGIGYGLGYGGLGYGYGGLGGAIYG